MTTCEAALTWLNEQPTDWRERRAPRWWRASITEAYVLNRGRIHGDTLRAKIKQHVLSESAVPEFLISLLLNIVIRIIVNRLEDWWNNRKELGHA